MGRKKKKQEPLQINAASAYVSAVEVLIIARSIALERKDHVSMIEIANSWIEIGNSMLTHELELVYDDEEGTAMSVPDAQPELVGFGFLGGIGGKEETEPSPGADEDRH